MGGLSGHHGHPYIVQTVAFLASMLLPGSALALVAGAYWERLRARRDRGPAGRPTLVGKALALTDTVALVAEPSAD